MLTKLYDVFSDAQGQLTPKSAAEFSPNSNSRAANSEVLGRILLKFELVRDIIDILVTCKYEEDPIKNEGARVLTRFSPL